MNPWISCQLIGFAQGLRRSAIQSCSGTSSFSVQLRIRKSPSIPLFPRGRPESRLSHLLQIINHHSSIIKFSHLLTLHFFLTSNIQHSTFNIEVRIRTRNRLHFEVRCSEFEVRCYPIRKSPSIPLFPRGRVPDMTGRVIITRKHKDK